MFRKLFLLTLTALLVLLVPLAIAQQNEPITITYSTWATGPSLDPDLAAIEGFQELFPNVNVEIEIRTGSDWAEINNQILVRMAAGTAPDLILTAENWALNYVGAGIMNLRPFIEGENGFDPYELFYPRVYETGLINGEPYYLTKDYATIAFLYNRDLFDAAGVPYPQEGWTYDDMLDAALQLTIDSNGNNALSPDFDPDNIAQYGLWAPAWPRAFQAIARSFGAVSISPDGSQTSGYVNSPEYIQAAEFYRDLVHRYKVSPTPATLQAQPGVDPFRNGSIAMRGWYGPWLLTTYNETPGLNFGVAPLPVGPEGPANVICQAFFGINETTAHPEETWELLRYLAAGPGQLQYGAFALPTMPSVAEELGIPEDPQRGVFLAGVEHIAPLDDMTTPLYAECVDARISQFMSFILSEEGADADIAELLNTLAEQADTCIARGA
ncbi:MAG: sugar ABC transporter substrate-binding protein [Aggregatilineales bacterium]